MLRVVDLPAGTLKHVASYLATPSRGFFAVAIDNNDDDGSSIITGEPWDTLDFGEVEKDLAARLSDDDISAVLLCIEAVNTVKRLRLSGCVNITGVGLEPLQGSSVIEQIDLSLVGDHEIPALDPKPPISLQLILPILDTIIGNEENKLIYLHFPHVWREERSVDSEFYAFIVRYNEMRNNRGGCNCIHCNHEFNVTSDGGYVGWIGTAEDDSSYGIHCNTCHKCMKHQCYHCNQIGGDEDGGTQLVEYCGECEREYCIDCCEMVYCDRCAQSFCEDCKTYVKCDSTRIDSASDGKKMRRYECTTEICGGCAPSQTCDYCQRVICDESCWQLLKTCESCHIHKCDECENVPWCSNLNVPWCSNPHQDHSLCLNCIIREFREGGLHCKDCKVIAADFLLEENIRLNEEVEKNIKRVEELETENKLLREGREL